MSALLIQLIGLIGTALYFVSYQFRDNRRLFAAQFLSYLFYTIHLLLLGAATGGVSYIINTFRSLCLAGRWKFAKTKKMAALIILLQMAAAYLTWAGWISLLPVVANIASTVGGYTHDARKIRLAGMCVNSPLWIVYDIIVGSWAGVLDEAVSMTSMAVSLIRFGRKAPHEAE